MKNFIVLVIFFLSIVFNFDVMAGKTSKKVARRTAKSSKKSKATRKASGGRRSALSKGNRVKNEEVKEEDKKPAVGDTENKVLENQEEKKDETYNSCMDKYCINEMDPDKARCRCSAQLTRIGKILRDIEKAQNKADEQNKNLEVLMNVDNTASVNDNLGAVYENINSVEKKAKNMSFGAMDKNFGVLEGIQLYNKAHEKCEPLITDKEKMNAFVADYKKKIETDCSAYTTVLKDKADNVNNLLVQAQKNQEKFNEQEYKKLNQLETPACYIEYETCMKTQCGENFTKCAESQKRKTFIKKCRAINYGKCEQNISVVLVDLNKTINKALEIEKVRQSCRSAMGQLIGGQCMFKFQYRADSCGSGKTCGTMDEKFFLPGTTVVCDDRRGSFKELKTGCHEKCYIVSENDRVVRYWGTNVETDGNKTAGKVFGAIFSLGLSTISSNAQPGCKSDGDLDKYYVPVPEGWKTDGYPANPEIKNEI